MKPYLEKISSNVDLTYEEAADAMQLIMSGESTAAQFGSFVTGLRMKGETFQLKSLHSSKSIFEKNQTK